MSVERRGGDKNYSTVQRRGEKKTILPVSKSAQPTAHIQTAREREVSKSAPPQTNKRYDVKITAAGFDSAAFEQRVQQRLMMLEADPVAKKAFLKKVDGWIGKAVFAFVFMIAIPPLAGLVIAFGLFYLFLTSLKPKDPNRVAKTRQIAEDAVVALKLKQSGKR